MAIVCRAIYEELQLAVKGSDEFVVSALHGNHLSPFYSCFSVGYLFKETVEMNLQ